MMHKVVMGAYNDDHGLMEEVEIFKDYEKALRRYNEVLRSFRDAERCGMIDSWKLDIITA